MDTIRIQGIQVEAVMGVYEWERTCAQPLKIDLILFVDVRKAADSDHLNDTVDYGAVVTWIREDINQHAFQLLEALAEHIATQLLLLFSIKKIEVTVHKLGILDKVDNVAVQVTRHRES